MKVTKVYCDRCGKEIPEKIYNKICTQYQWNGNILKLDLCPSCDDEFLNMVEKWKDIKNDNSKEYVNCIVQVSKDRIKDGEIVTHVYEKDFIDGKYYFKEDIKTGLKIQAYL